MWTFEYGWDDKMGDALAAAPGRCKAILLGRKTYEMFEPVWSTRTVEQDPGAPFFNDTTKCVVSGTLKDATWRNSEVIGPYDAESGAAAHVHHDARSITQERTRNRAVVCGGVPRGEPVVAALSFPRWHGTDTASTRAARVCCRLDR